MPLKSRGSWAAVALPHGVGHGWAAILWDLNWDLIDKHGFNPDVYGAWNTGGNNRAIQYMIDGLKMQGCEPGFVVASRAVIAAADTLSAGEDTCTVLHDANAGQSVPLRFTADGRRDPDILASGAPYSRQVDCATLATVTPGSLFITPRPIPEPTQGGPLTVDGQGMYQYDWKTLRAWQGTCRELVLTRDDGRQHRAFFRFG
jgi:extracellular elastinolytic metalloproteinase